MKRVFVIFVAVAAILSSGVLNPLVAKSGMPHRVMSCNIRVTGLEADNGYHGRPWDERKEVCLDIITSYDPDIICMQEVVYDSYAFMKQELDDDYFIFGFSGPEMDPYTEGYHNIAKNVIFFRRLRYEFISAGCYWLSESPLIAGSCSWDTARARHCNWVRIRDRNTGIEFRVLDVHLDHVSEAAKRNQSMLIVEESSQYLPAFPQILCGDFNAGKAQMAVTTLVEAGWSDVYSDLHPGEEDQFTAHLFQGEDYKPKGPAKRIDFIFTKGPVRALSSAIIRDSRNEIYPSDHFFIMADLEIEPEHE